MPTHHLNDATRAARAVHRLSAILPGLALAAVHALASASDADIEIVAVKGDVRITTAGKEFTATAGATLELPSTLRTGKDGSADLRQGDTTIGIGPGTELDFPATGTPDGPVDRIVQPLGNAFYSVGPRGNRRLRVETPYLVAVIKGTQFSVAVEPDGGTISLHEGSLEILAPDLGASILLDAGEMASRHRGDEAIRVIPMRESVTPASISKGAKPGAKDADGPVVLGHDAAATKGSGAIAPIDPVEDKVTLDARIDADDLAGVDTSTDIEVAVDLDSGKPDTTLDVGVDLGAGPIDASLDGGVDAGLDLGAGTVDAGVDLGVDLGVVDADVGLDAGVDASAGTVDLGLEVLDTGIDVGLGSDSLIDIDVDPTTEADDSGGLLGGVLRRIGL